MKSGQRNFLIVAFLVAAGAAIAAYVNRWPSQLFPHEGKVVTMSFGLALSPYVIADSASGFQLDIIREALAMGGHTLKPVFVPLAHVPNLLKIHQGDAAERRTGRGPRRVLREEEIRRLCRLRDHVEEERSADQIGR